MKILCFLILFFILLSSKIFLACAQETQKPQIFPQEIVKQGEELEIKVRLVDKLGQPVLNASVRAYSDFFDLVLYDDGKHKDNNTNDGIYSNQVLANAAIGSHTITVVYHKGNVSDTSTFTIKIVEKPKYGLYVYTMAIICILAFGVFSLYKKLKTKTELEKKIIELENKKKDTQKLIRKTEIEYFSRIIDEKTFRETMQKYRGNMAEIEMELKRLKTKQKKRKKH